jgi:hypothetical protein
MRGVSLTYNSVQLALTKTNSITARPVYTNNNNDYRFTEITIDINAIFNPSETAYISDGPLAIADPTALPPVTYNAVQTSLNTPRGQLQFDNYLTTMFNLPDEDAGWITDANNGPFPQELSIIEINGGQTFHVRYVIKTFIYQCDLAETSDVAWISNEYSQSESIDEHFYSSITTTGMAYFRIEVLDEANGVADDFRDVLLPPIPRGYRRMAIDIKVNETRNILIYSCVDHQMPYEIGNTGQSGDGSFITKIDGSWVQSSLTLSANNHTVLPTGYQIGTATIKIWGSRQASVWVLTQKALAIIGSTRIDFTDGTQPIRDIRFSQSLVDRYVELSISVTLKPAANGQFGSFQTAALRNDTTGPGGLFGIGSEGGVNPSPPSDNGTRSDTPFVLLTAALTDACLGTDGPPCMDSAAGTYGQNGTYCGPTPIVSVTPTDIIPSGSNSYSQPTTQYPYTRASINSRYETQHGVMQAPYAGSPQSNYVSGGGQQPSNPTCSVFNLYSPYTLRIVEWECERLNGILQIPSLNSSDPNQILLSSKILSENVAILVDGSSVVLGATGRYTYAFLADITTIDTLNYDIPQWVGYPYGQFQIALNNTSGGTGGAQIHGLIDPGAGPTV